MAEAMSEECASSWDDAAPITDEQIEAVRAGLGNGSDGAPVYYQFSRAVVRKLLAEVDRLNTQAAYMREQMEQMEQVIEERKAQTVVYRALAEAHQKRGDKLSAQLVEAGETRLEFGYRFPGTDGDPDVQGYDDEATARRIANHGDTVMRRHVGDWEVLPDA